VDVAHHQMRREELIGALERVYAALDTEETAPLAEGQAAIALDRRGAA